MEGPLLLMVFTLKVIRKSSLSFAHPPFSFFSSHLVTSHESSDLGIYKLNLQKSLASFCRLHKHVLGFFSSV